MPQAQNHPSDRPPRSELRAALSACGGAFAAVGLMSCMINLLYLTGSFFMLEVYDRVLPSRSVPTLIVLGLLAGGLYLSQGLLEWVRSRVLVRIGSVIDESLSDRVFAMVARLPLIGPGQGGGQQPIRDLDNIRGFLSGPGPSALFDLPWLPFYLAICFAFHSWIGLTALAGAVLLVTLTVLTEVLARAPAREATTLAIRRSNLAAASQRNAEVLTAMAMTAQLGRRWREANSRLIDSSRRGSDVTGGLGAIAKVMRLTLQSAVLGVGAYLVIQQQATAGIIIAGSILSARALAPVDLAIGNWKSFIQARQSWTRLEALLRTLPPPPDRLRLHPAEKSLAVERLCIAAPGEQRLIAQDLSFTLEAGHGVGIIGPSGSGKSSLARALVGVWAPVRGQVRLDGAALDQWPPDQLGRQIGYLPQDVELFSGTIADNIARFDPEATSDAVIAAAKQAGVHELILGLRDGYGTEIGDNGRVLSAGQAQRIGLARALYGDPFLIVLDEPNSNLDSDGDEALNRAVRSARARGAIVVVIAHRPVGIEAVDLLMVLKDGKLQAFGPKETVLPQLAQRPPAPIKIVADGGVAKP